MILLFGSPPIAVTGGQSIIAIRAGTVTGIVVRSNEARTAGTLTVTLALNGYAQPSLTAVLDGTNTTYKVTTTTTGVAYAAGDTLGVAITTTASWAPTTADITVMIEMTESG